MLPINSEKSMSVTHRYLSVIIPVYNEESILVQAVDTMVANLQKRGWDYEIILCENGSRDKTWALVNDLAKKYSTVRTLQVGTPGNGNYGLALKTGILASNGELVVNDEIDIGNFDFYDQALRILSREPDVAMVVGSKTLASSNDKRPMMRRFATWCVNMLLRVLLGFKGTDTHGLKAWRRTKLESLVRDCITERDIFTSEFVIRTERAGYTVHEIPIEIAETRAARIPLIKRVPHVLKNIWTLFLTLRFQKNG
jgi:glycosyltransferase involved in cell wall biosynthesis